MNSTFPEVDSWPAACQGSPRRQDDRSKVTLCSLHGGPDPRLPRLMPSPRSLARKWRHLLCIGCAQRGEREPERLFQQERAAWASRARSGWPAAHAPLGTLQGHHPVCRRWRVLSPGSDTAQLGCQMEPQKSPHAVLHWARPSSSPLKPIASSAPMTSKS